MSFIKFVKTVKHVKITVRHGNVVDFCQKVQVASP